MNKIYIFLGKSNSGKDTIFKEVQKKTKLKNIVGYSTRPMRDGEINGREYFFVNNEEYERLKKEGFVIESRDYNTAHGVWSYFTVDDGQINLEKESYIYIATLDAYEKIRDYFGKERVVPVYIEVENSERLIRAINREKKQKEPKYVELCRRFIADEEDFCEKKIKRLGINRRFQNNNLDKCVAEICEAINKKSGSNQVRVF